MLNISQGYVNEQISIQKKEIERRLMIFRGSKQYHLQEYSSSLTHNDIRPRRARMVLDMLRMLRWIVNRDLVLVIQSVLDADRLSLIFLS
jgi:hypothetical protein